MPAEPLWVPAILLMPTIDGAQIGLFCRAEESALESCPLYPAGLVKPSVPQFGWLFCVG